MASEMRRAAKALVATRVESFASPLGIEASRERLEAALRRAGAPRYVRLRGDWKDAQGGATYEATFAPSPRVHGWLRSIALALVLLAAASAWVLHVSAQGAPARFALPLLTVLAVFAMPFAVGAIAAQREAEESRIVRAIRAALRGESAQYPPQQRWADED